MFGKAFKATFGVGCALVVGLIALVVISGALVSGSRDVQNVLISAGATTASQRATATSAAAPQTFVVVKEWTGSGIKNTEDFTVGAQWKIKATIPSTAVRWYLADRDGRP